MQIRLDTSTPVPPFEQIRAQIALAVSAGRLRAGERLPTIRALSTDLAVSPNTVARAYRELISAGIAEAGGRSGTRITQAPPVAHNVVQQSERITDAARDFAATVRSLGVPIDEALEAAIIALRADT